MSQRTLLGLLAALIVLGALVALGQRERAPSATGAGDVLAPGLEAALNDVERVAVVGPGNAPIATLERRDGAWSVAEKGGYAADVVKLRQGLRALAEAHVLETKTANPEFYDRLGVQDIDAADAGGIAVAVTAPGKELPTLILGNAEGSRYRYARRAGEQQSYLIDRNPDLPRDAAQWVDATVVDIAADRVRQVTITHPDGEIVTISKADATIGNYDVAAVPAGRELLYPGVANVVAGALRELKLEDVEAGANEAAAERPTVVEFRTFDGLVVRATGTERDDEAWLTFEASVDPEHPAVPASATPETGGAPAATDTAAAEAERINARVRGWRYRIAAFQYDQMTRRMSDLLKPPPAA